MSLRLLVLDAYARDGRAEIAAGGASEAGVLYARRLHELVPDADVAIAYPADGDESWRTGGGLLGYDGLVWTGSSLTIHAEGDERVRRQIDLARVAFEEGVPSFGSCWAAQLAVVAAGGACGPNPRGREFGVSRKIELTEEGASHPLFAGKPRVFDALTSHQDEIQTLPTGTRWLATNDFTRIQAVSVEHRRGRFWAVQYHPEYDLREVARLGHVRTPVLIEQGSFADAEMAAGWVADFEALHAAPGRRDLRFRYALDEDILDPARRMCELANWLDHEAKPRANARQAGG